ncbi:hypothetical protein ACFL1A_02060 [Patescibacteria group bacterium]
MKTKHITTTFLLTILALFAMSGQVFADGNCTTNYGGKTICTPTDLNINKQVQDPVTGLYVENITTPKFSQDDRVNFKLIVTNNSGETFTGVEIKDNAPENILIDEVSTSLKDGVKTEIASDKKSALIKLDKMTVGQSIDVYVMTHLVGSYPTEDNFCRDNWSEVRATARPEGDTNFARFCVTNKVLGETTLPTAGVTDILYVLPFLGTGLGGAALLKKRNNIVESS